jgi:hypothetical protein
MDNRSSAEFLKSATLQRRLQMGLMGLYTFDSIRDSFAAFSEPRLIRRRSEMFVRCLAAFSSIMVLVSSASIVSAQEKLAWKFTSGESLKYVVKQNMNMTMVVASKTQTIAMNQTMDMRWKIADVDSGSGDANMSQTIDRVQMNSQGGPFGVIEYDSAGDKIPESPLGKSMAEVFRRIIGEEFGVHMKTTGKIDQVSVPQSLIDALKQAGSAGNALDETTLKQMMTQSAITLPETKLNPNDSWDSVQQVELPFGTMTVKSQLTYQGIDPGSGYAKIAMIPVISVEPKPGAPVTLTLTKSAGTGLVLFDAAKGRIAKSDLDLTMQMQVKSFGQVIDQTIKQTTSMSLAN